MAKLTEYPAATSFDSGDILIKDGTNGTKKISVDDASIKFIEIANKTVSSSQIVTLDDCVLITNDTDGVRKILASNIGGSSGGVNYSTTEQDTGLKWIDGKPIYQKTIVLADEIYIPSSGTSIPSANFNGLNIENIVHATAYRLISDNRDGCANIPVSVWLYNGDYNVYAIGTWSGVQTITIQYTKTTDQPSSTVVGVA